MSRIIEEESNSSRSRDSFIQQQNIIRGSKDYSDLSIPNSIQEITLPIKNSDWDVSKQVRFIGTLNA